MRISIFGMGYVGAVCAACLANRGHQIIGVDVNRDKVAMINAGRSPIVEPGLENLLCEAVESGRLAATLSASEAIAQTDLSFIAVPTPSYANGNLNLEYIKLVCREIGVAMRSKSQYHTVVVRSTVLPGTVMQIVKPALEEATGWQAGVDFGIAVNPEFLREGTAIDDFKQPPMTVFGGLDANSLTRLKELYTDLPAPMYATSIEVAEMVKYACNAWHAVKVAFANEIGSIAKACQVDGREVMDIFCADTKLNISSYYLRPGFAFGGSCLPKDLRALTYRASQLDVKHPLLGSVIESNENHIKNSYRLIELSGKRKIGFLGLSFKAGTDDLREAPQVNLVETLIGKGYQVKIFDANVSYAKVHGANRDYIERRIPHISSLLQNDIDAVLEDSECIVIGNGDQAFTHIFEKIQDDHHLLDLSGLMAERSMGNRQGICW